MLRILGLNHATICDLCLQSCSPSFTLLIRFAVFGLQGGLSLQKI